jgi:hypothetical protein
MPKPGEETNGIRDVGKCEPWRRSVLWSCLGNFLFGATCVGIVVIVIQTPSGFQEVFDGSVSTDCGAILEHAPITATISILAGVGFALERYFRRQR